MKKYTRNITKLRRTQGCLTDCIAYYFNLHPENVPFFVYPRKDWMKRVGAFFSYKGYDVLWKKIESIPKNGMYIICGDSLVYKTYSHVVVYRNGKLVYDPEYPSKWKDKRATHCLVVKRKVAPLKKKNNTK